MIYNNLFCSCVCMLVCSLITWERLRRSPTNFQGSSRVPRGWVGVRKLAFFISHGTGRPHATAGVVDGWAELLVVYIRYSFDAGYCSR